MVNSEYDREDITDQVDCGRLVQIIEGYTRNRLRHAFAPYQMMVGDVEINGVSGSKSMHILLGSVDVVYESGEKGGYTIHDVEQLERDVREILP